MLCEPCPACAAGVGTLQRSCSQRSGTLPYQRGTYGMNTANYAEPYRPAHYHPGGGSYARQGVAVDDGATRSPSIDSIQKDPR